MSRSLVGVGLDRAATFEESPVTRGFMAGLKAAIIGAPVGAAVQAFRGHDALGGAVLGALIPGILAGLARAGAKKVQNLDTEAYLRYHADQIKSREPEFFLPPKQYLGKYFTRRYD